MTRILKSQRGFSILENMLSMVIVAAGLVGGMVTLQNASLNSMHSDRGSIATQLANEKIETILADKQFNGYDTLTNLAYGSESFSGELGGFTRSVNIYEVSADDLTTPTEGSGLKRVEVIVNWEDQNEQQIHVSTLVSSYVDPNAID